MLLNKYELQHAEHQTGFRAEIIEKVILLVDLLDTINKHNYLKSRLVLKGGTALNLFHFNLPRLSIDIDLNYIGSIDRQIMLNERQEINSIIKQLITDKGFTIERSPNYHAGGKYHLRYPSVLGHRGILEFDFNYMHRQLFYPVEQRESFIIAGYKTTFPSLNFNEIAAGKLCALFARDASRDLFDVYQIIKQMRFDFNQIRTLFMVYGAMDGKKDWRKITLDDINAKQSDLKNKLIPMLSRNNAAELKKQKNIADEYVKTCREALQILFPLKNNEIQFYNQLFDHGNIQPELISEDKSFCEKVKKHPGIVFQANQAKWRK